jgi:hypothetical protein
MGIAAAAGRLDWASGSPGSNGNGSDPVLGQEQAAFELHRLIEWLRGQQLETVVVH